MSRQMEQSEIERELQNLPGWSHSDGMLKRVIEAPDFPMAIAIVDAVAVVAEEMDHHPDIDIRYRTLSFALATHSAGGITELDLALARRISQIEARQIS